MDTRTMLGARLAALRHAAGLTQHQLAAAVHYSRSMVANVEVGRQRAPLVFWTRCDEALSAGGALIDGFHASLQHRFTTQTAPVVYVPFQPSALDRPALDWLLDDGTAPPDDGGSDEAARAWRRLQRLRDRDHRLGAGAVAGEVDDFLATDVRQLLTGQPRTLSGCRVAVGAYELAGYQAVDIGADGLAQRRYLHALTLTCGDRCYGAYLLAVSLGHLALHCGFPARALRMAQTAIRGTAGRVSLAVDAAIHAVLARAHARLGDEAGCVAALRAAEARLARSDRAQEPPWIGYLTEAYLADEVAHCLYDLGHHDSARREVTQAVTGVEASHVRRWAIDTALLASSLARAGEVDEACVQARHAVELATRTSSARTVQRVAQVRADLLPYAGTRVVDEFSEYADTTLPASVIR